MEQMSLFAQVLPTYKVTKPIALIELFAGYGSQALALRYMGIPFEHHRVCEWNWKSNYAYSLMHDLYQDHSQGMTKDDLVKALQGKGISSDWNTPMTDEQIAKMKEDDLRHAYNAIVSSHNTVDISRTHASDLGIEPLREREREYLMTYSFPCQDLSLAGKGLGMEEDSNTRSSLLWQVSRVLHELAEKDELPNILMMENVVQVHGAGNEKAWRKWCDQLTDLGYSNFFEDLSATDYGIPQTRVRTIMVSVLGKWYYKYQKPQALERRLKDFLESDVDEKYFLTEKQMKNITLWNNTDNRIESAVGGDKSVAKTLTTFAGRNDYNCNYVNVEKIGATKDKGKYNTRTDVIGSGGSTPTLTSTDYKHPVLVGAYTPSGRSGKVFDRGGTMTTITTGNHGNVNGVCLPIKEATRKGYAEATDGDGVYISNLKGKRGTVQKDKIQTIKTSLDVGVVVSEDDKER